MPHWGTLMTGIILCHDCEKQECQDIVLKPVICGSNMISVSVALSRINSHYAIIIPHTFFRSHNPLNNDGLIESKILRYIQQEECCIMPCHYKDKIQ